jgi:hypothetical protein
MANITGFPKLSTTSEVTFNTKGQISRWSDTGVSPDGCAAIVVPSTEEDIVAVVKFAAQNGFKVLPTAGKHGAFLPIDERSIYLDLKNFDSIELDDGAGSVKVGGGVVTGHLCSVLAEKGWYTSRPHPFQSVRILLTAAGHPNSNAVGMVGYVLGGGNSVVNGIHSLAVDNLLEVRILTDSGVFLTLSPNSLGDENDLFNVICGAGFGFGVITSITLKAWRIADLGMEDNKVWTRRLIFPSSAISTAAELFADLSSPPPEMSTTLLFLRALPSAPHPGAPMIMMILTCLGPAASAEEACKASFDPKYTTKATVASTALADFASLNTAADVFNRHGDFKTNHSTWAHHIDSHRIQSGYERWLQLGQLTPDAEANSYFVISARNPTCMLSRDLQEETFFPRTIRERKIFIQAAPWWTETRSEEKCREWSRDMLCILGERGEEAEKVNGFAANLNKDVEVAEFWPQAKIQEIRRLKGIWDAGNVFWNPVVDGM